MTVIFRCRNKKETKWTRCKGGYQALQIRLLNGRIFQKLLSKEPDAQYRSEQGKILTVLWQKSKAGQLQLILL